MPLVPMPWTWPVLLVPFVLLMMLLLRTVVIVSLVLCIMVVFIWNCNLLLLGDLDILERLNC